MALFGRLFGGKEQKEEPVTQPSAEYKSLYTLFGPMGYNSEAPDKNSEVLAREAYIRNSVVRKCMTEMTDNLSIFNWYVARDGQAVPTNTTEPTSSKLRKLLRRPNPEQRWPEFMQSIINFKLLNGDAYVLSIPNGNGTPQELWVIEPWRIQYKFNENGLISEYEIVDPKTRRVERRIPRNPVNGQSEMFHTKMWNPLNTNNGTSPVIAAWTSILVHNMINNHNMGLLKNGATPSGVLEQPANGETITDAQRQQLKQMLESYFTGDRNAGKTMVLTGGLQWKQLGLSPKDMDWENLKNSVARDICNALNVPSQLVGIPGDNTYSNYKEARQAFIQNTIMPMADSFARDFGDWLISLFPKTTTRALTIEFDPSDHPAMHEQKTEMMDKLNEVSFLTINEKRRALGYEELNNGNVLQERPPRPTPVETRSQHVETKPIAQTTEVNNHSHKWDYGSQKTSCETAPGDDECHTHPMLYNEEGIPVGFGEANGHTHDFSGT